MQKNNKKTPGTADITMKSELKKVIWPTGKQTIKNTWITILFVAIISVMLIALDFIFNKVSTKYYSLILDTEGHQHQTILSGDDISGELADIIKDLTSGEQSGEVSGEVDVVSGEQAE